MVLRLRRFVLVMSLVGLIVAPSEAGAYSVLAHEATIDALWNTGIEPLLLGRFPGTSADALTRARSYAYGGSLVHDLGYYPFGSRFFSNLLHYVRSGDFIAALIRDARNVDEYAFALGALAHYATDNIGHPVAVNKAVPIVFPKLRDKYGDEVTYAQAHKPHVLVEFSFDVVQAAGGTYLPEAYRRFIGFRVAEPLLERAFGETYAIEMKEVFVSQDLAIGTFRYAVSQVFPAITAAAWRDKRDEITKRLPDIHERGFVFLYSPANYDSEFGSGYRKPGLFARFLAFLYRLVPKIGPLRVLTFKPPTPETEAWFTESFVQASEQFGLSLKQVRDDRVALENTDFDTGDRSHYGESSLADDTYVELLHRLAKREFTNVSDELRRNIGAFYSGRRPLDHPSRSQRNAWNDLQRQLDALQNRRP